MRNFQPSSTILTIVTRRLYGYAIDKGQRRQSIFRVNETTIDDQYWMEYAIHVYFEESTPCLNLVTKNFSKDRYLSLIKSVVLLSPLKRIYVAEWKIFETFGRYSPM